MIVESLFLAVVAGAGLTFGFATAAKSRLKNVTPEGAALATRALMWGSLWAVGGVGAISFVVWKAMGVHSLEEFRQKAGQMLPKLTSQKGRTEFANLRELVEYIENQRDEKKEVEENTESAHSE